MQREPLYCCNFTAVILALKAGGVVQTKVNRRKHIRVYENEDDVEEVLGKLGEVLKGLDRVIVGYQSEKRILIATLLSSGHVLLEGVPGTAKTTLVKALAKLLGLLGTESSIDGVPYKGFSRIQFTPDLLPADVTGSLIYNPLTRDFEVRFGPIFAYLLLADEVNRATPRTQSALLEAMQERQVTIGGRTYKLEDRTKGKFFFVAATQNPVEQEGTYPLPEAQLDRFATRILIGYPETLEEERAILRLHAYRLGEPLEDLEPCADPDWIVRAQEYVAENVKVEETIINYAATVVRMTRPEINRLAADYFELGSSPRAAITLLRVAKAWALINSRDYVTERDVDEVLFAVLNHRVIPKLDRMVEYEEKHGRYVARYKVTAEGLEAARKSVREIL